MKTRMIIIAAISLGTVNLTAPRVEARLEVGATFEINAETDFYEPLTSYGTWVEVGSYGRCWRPASVAVEWRPYSYGHWVWTDVGWYWVSDEPWGWACYHYGRWAYDPGFGWVWVPGVDWAPAWVSWREGGGYIGWAPLPPAVGFSGGVIVAEHVRVVQPSYFVFVQTGRFLEPVRPRTVIVNNTTIINKTVNITNIRQENKTFTTLGARRVVVNEGPRVDTVAKATSRPVHATSIADVARQASPPGTLRDKRPQPQQTSPPGQLKRESLPTQREPSLEQPKREAVPSQRELPPGQLKHGGTPPQREPPAAGPQEPPAIRPESQKPTDESPPREKIKKHDRDNEEPSEGEGPPAKDKEERSEP